MVAVELEYNFVSYKWPNLSYEKYNDKNMIHIGHYNF